MQKSSLITILRTLTPQEFREFGEFVKSPYFNKNEKVITLYNVLKKYFPGFDSGSLTKEKVFKDADVYTSVFIFEKEKDKTYNKY